MPNSPPMKAKDFCLRHSLRVVHFTLIGGGNQSLTVCDDSWYTLSMPSFVETIKEARVRLELSGRQLAERMAWKSSSYVSMIEIGQRNISLDEVGKLASALDLDRKQLIRLYLSDYYPDVYRVLFSSAPTLPAHRPNGRDQDLAGKIALLNPQDRNLIEQIVDRVGRSC